MAVDLTETVPQVALPPVDHLRHASIRPGLSLSRPRLLPLRLHDCQLHCLGLLILRIKVARLYSQGFAINYCPQLLVIEWVYFGLCQSLYQACAR